MSDLNQSPETFTVFKIFQDLEQAKEFANALKENGIESKLIDNSPAFDITFSQNTLEYNVQVHIKQSDFENANKVLEKESDKIIEQIDKDHYMFEFSNEELYEVLLKHDEWSVLDYKLAIKILKDRGEHVNDTMLKSIKKQRIEDLRKPIEGQKAYIYVGYFFSLLGGVLGIFMGWYIANIKKALPNGERVYAYSESDRTHGKIMFFLGIIFFIFWAYLEYRTNIILSW